MGDDVIIVTSATRAEVSGYSAHNRCVQNVCKHSTVAEERRSANQPLARIFCPISKRNSALAASGEERT